MVSKIITTKIETCLDLKMTAMKSTLCKNTYELRVDSNLRSPETEIGPKNSIFGLNSKQISGPITIQDKNKAQFTLPPSSQVPRVYHSEVLAKLNPPSPTCTAPPPIGTATMSSLLVKRLSSLFCPSSFQCHHHYLALPNLLLRLSFSTQPSGPKEIPFVAKYLTSSLGFSPVQALKVSADKNVLAIKSADRPDSVVKFLKGTGLSDTQIRSAILFHPRLLCCNMEKTMKPKLRELMDAGFSGELLVQLIRYNPSLPKNPLSHLLFWREFVGKSEQVLLKIIQRNGLLMQYNIDSYVTPRINLFKEYGFSNQDIVRVLAHGYCMSRSLDSLRETLECIEEMGIPRESGMFLRAFKSMGGYTKNALRRKVEFFKMTYGWSQEELCSAFTKAPCVFSLSEDNIKSHMNFLIQKAKLDPRSVASQPLLLGYSLEKRLMPRHHVLSILATKGLKKKFSLSTACNVPEKRFLEMFVEPYKKIMPELAKAYFASSDKNESVCSI
jgi:mTERF domain-containing protein, mitochondrial